MKQRFDVQYGILVEITPEDSNEYEIAFGQDRRVLRQCVACGEEVVCGDLAVQSVPGHWRRRPRVCCSRCAVVHAERSGVVRICSEYVSSVFEAYYAVFGETSKKKVDPTLVGNQVQLLKPLSILQKGRALTPFLEITTVVPNSAAWNAGLLQGDVVLQFGPFTKQGFSTMEAILKFVRENGTKPISITIGRNLVGNGTPRMQRTITVNPFQWDHGTALGIVLCRFPSPQAHIAG